MFSDDQLRRKDIDTLRHWLRQKLGGYMIAVKDMPRGQRLYRGVRCPKRPETISRISYPPPEITTVQRLNRAGQSRFYCSAAGPAVFYELHATTGDLIALSEWEVVEPLWMHNLGFHPQALKLIGAQADNISMRHRVTHPIPNESKANARLRFKLSRAFTADVPSGKEYRYKQSIAINESLSEEVELRFPENDPGAPRHKKVAGTVYPTMKMRGDADNAVVLPEFVDSSLRIRSVRYVKVEDADETKSYYALLTLGISNRFSGDMIEWESVLGSEIDHRSFIRLEGGHWVLRDGYGRIYHFQ